MKTTTTLLLNLLILTSSCHLFVKNKSSVREKESGAIEMIQSEDFNHFYDAFLSDSLYQINHVQFPIEGMIAECDTSIELTKTNWKFLKDDFRSIKESELNSIKIEQSAGKVHFILIRNEIGIIQEMTFIKKDNEWYLVYYFLNLC
jgi:hypothetical protein